MKKILIVDDMQEYLRSLSRALAGGYEVEISNSLEEAKMKADGTINLALVDVRLSEKDMANREGILFLGWLKEKYPDVPVVMMSAYRDFDSAVDSLNLGSSRYLKKPINLRKLKDLLAELLKESD